MRGVVVFGPVGCGMARHASDVAAHFGADKVLPGWVPGQDLPGGAVALTNVPGVPGAYAFDDVMSRIAALVDC